MAPSRIPRGSTVEDWPFGLEELEPHYDAVERELGVSGKAGNINGTDRHARQHLRRPATARIPDASVAGHRLHRDDGDAARTLRWHPFPGPAAINSRGIRTGPAARITGTATEVAATSGRRDRPLSPRFQKRSRQVVCRSSREATVTTDRGRRRRAGHRRRTISRTGPSTSSRRTSSCWRRTSTRTSACCCSRRRRPIRKDCRTTTVRSAGITSATARVRRSRRCSHAT